MNRFIAFIAILISASAHGSTVTGLTTTVSSAPFNAPITIEGMSLPLSNGASIVTGPKITIVPSGGGFTNWLETGHYKFTQNGSSFAFDVPNDSNTYNLNTLRTSALPIYSYTYGSGFPGMVRVSTNDTTPGYFSGKMVPGTGISFVTNSPNGDASISITATGEFDQQTNFPYTAITNAPWITNNTTFDVTLNDYTVGNTAGIHANSGNLRLSPETGSDSVVIEWGTLVGNGIGLTNLNAVATNDSRALALHNEESTIYASTLTSTTQMLSYGISETYLLHGKRGFSIYDTNGGVAVRVGTDGIIVGNGSGVTNLSASNLASGSVLVGVANTKTNSMDALKLGGSTNENYKLAMTVSTNGNAFSILDASGNLKMHAIFQGTNGATVNGVGLFRGDTNLDSSTYLAFQNLESGVYPQGLIKQKFTGTDAPYFQLEALGPTNSMKLMSQSNLWLVVENGSDIWVDNGTGSEVRFSPRANNTVYLGSTSNWWKNVFTWTNSPYVEAANYIYSTNAITALANIVVGTTLQMSNNNAIQWRDSAGTLRSQFTLTSGDNLNIRNTATGGDVFFGTAVSASAIRLLSAGTVQFNSNVLAASITGTNHITSVNGGITNLSAAPISSVGTIIGNTATTVPAFKSTATNNIILKCPDGGSFILRVDNTGVITAATNSTGL